MSLSVFNGGYTGLIQVGLYSDNAGQPDTLLSSSSPSWITLGGAWRTVDIPDVVIPGAGTYWLAFESANSPNWVNISNTPLLSGTHYRKVNTFGTLPASITSPEVWLSDWSIYANYCRPAGALTDTPTVTPSPTPTPTLTFTGTPTDTPACISPSTFGNNNTYASYSIPSAYTYFQKAVASGPGTIMSLSVFNGGYTGLIQVGLYSDNAGQPDTLLSSSSPSWITLGGAWRTVDIPDVVIPGAGTYWLAFESANSPNWVNISNTPLLSGTHYRKVNTFGTLPASITSPEVWLSDWSIYANTCP